MNIFRIMSIWFPSPSKKFKQCNFQFMALVLLVFSCADLPTDPNNVSNSSVDLSLKTTTRFTAGPEVYDTVGNNVEFIIALRYPQFITSTTLQIMASNGLVEFDTSLSSLSKNNFDTIRFTKKIVKLGDKNVVATAHRNDGSTKSDTAFMHITERVSDTTHPVISFKNISTEASTVNSSSTTIELISTDLSGIKLVECFVGTVSCLVTKVNDTTYSIAIKDLVANQSTKVTIIVTDNSVVANKTTKEIYLKYDPNASDVTPPVLARFNPLLDSLSVSSATYSVQITCKDSSGIDTVTWSTGTTSYPAIKTNDSVYTAIVNNLTANQYTAIKFTAIDASPKANSATITTHLKYDSLMTDNTPPVIVLVKPLSAAVKIADTLTTVQISCKDENGIASVTCTQGGKTINVTNSDSIYSAAVLGLIAGKTDTIRFIAIDNSAAHNKDTLELIITCDPTMNDKTAPAIVLQTPADSSSVSSSSVAVGVKCTDSSGIKSVTCSVGGKLFDVTKDASDSYTANITGLVQGLNLVLFTVTDASTNANKTTDTFKIIYDPTIADNVAPAINLKNPLVNGEVVYKDSITIQIACKDESGIASVICKLAGQVVSVTNSADSLYSAKITGLSAGKADTITFTVTDKSTKANSCPFVVVVQYATYTVTYIGNGSTSGSVPTDAGTYEKGTTVTVKGNNDALVKTGSTFVGWNTLEDGTGTTYSGGDDFVVGTTNVTLYAKWTLNPTYTVTYSGNGNTGGSVPADTKNYEKGATVTVKGNSGILEKTGATFAGWNTLENGTGTTYSGGVDFIIGTANVTLYAKWTTYTVIYNGNGNTGGNVPTDDGPYYYHSTVILKGNNGSLVKTGYVFAGWNTLENGTGNTYSVGTLLVMGNSNVKLYAKWEIRDIDGNVYSEVTIGNQVWMVENLRTTKYNDGTPITLDTSTASWISATTGKYCYYNNTTNLDSIKKFGALYNGYAVFTKKLAPTGWHIPDTTEWNILENYLITNGYNYDETTIDNKIAKSMAAKTDWKAATKIGAIGSDLAMNNSSGFSALPGGCRWYDGSGFGSVGSYGRWWSATEFDMSEAYFRELHYGSDFFTGWRYSKIMGFAVRLVRD